jgi:hypothetical protein
MNALSATIRSWSWRCAWAIAVPLVLGGTALSTCAAAGDAFVFTGSLNEGRYAHTATSLADGKVLVTGGWGVLGGGYFTTLATAEVYDPVTSAFTQTGSMVQPRISSAAVRLVSGRVLVVGGWGPVNNGPYTALASAEIYDPATGAFSRTGDMATARSDMTATLLPDGTVLVVGGAGASYSYLATAEIYDPVSGTFSPTSTPMVAPRDFHTTTLLPNGRALVAGGCLQYACPAELYDVASRSFTAAAVMGSSHFGHSATLLRDGRVLIAGDPYGPAELYDPSTAVFTQAGGSTRERSPATVLLPNGNVLFTGGGSKYAERYEPASDAFQPVAALREARSAHTATLLPDGTVLVAGGVGSFFPSRTAERYYESGYVDTVAPTLTVPADMSVLGSGPEGATVYFQVTAADDVDASPEVSCAPASGSLFPVGTTSVVCTATDRAGNSATAGFRVSVIEPLQVVITVDPTGVVHPTTGLLTLSGTVSCTQRMNGYVSGQAAQMIRGSEVRGYFSREFWCVPPSLTWIASATSSSGGFQPGPAEVSVSVFGCDTLPSCDSDAATRAVELRERPSPRDPFAIKKIADNRSTPIPGGTGRFSFFTLPFVKNGTVAFVGYGAGQGIYASAGGRLRAIADSATPIPGRSGTFAYFDPPAFDGITFAFQGRDGLYVPGLYTSRDGALARIADSETPVPGGTETFRNFLEPSLSGERVAFRASSDYSPFFSFGIYVGGSDGLTAVADRKTPIPGGIGNFGYFGPATIEGDTVAFAASGFDSRQGIYATRDGVLTPIADASTAVPGGSGNFLFFGPLALKGGTVAFQGYEDSFHSGLYVGRPGDLNKVVDSRTPIPGRSALFSVFGDPVLDRGTVVFGGFGARFPEGGIYAGNGGALTTLADLNTPIPGGQGTITSLELPAVSRGRMAFIGADATSTRGLYVRVNGTLQKVISGTDTLEGKDVGWFQMANGNACGSSTCSGGAGTGFDGNRIAFLANFTDGSQGLYLATLPGTFKTFTAEVEVEDDGVDLEGTFALAADSNGIAPAREVVSLEIGNLTVEIPAGSFRPSGKEGAKFFGIIDGIRLKVSIQAPHSGMIAFKAKVAAPDLVGASDHVAVALAIGDDSGTAIATVRSTGHGHDDDTEDQE